MTAESPKRQEVYSLMNPREYEVMYRLETDYWWYRGLHHLTHLLIRREVDACDPSTVEIVDCGCGTGGMLSLLRQTYPKSMGFDYSDEAVEFCRSRGLEGVTKQSIVDFDLGEGRFDIAYSLDVLCNLNPEDYKLALSRIFASLKPGGAFIFHLPAFNSLKGEHDLAVGIYQRFRRPQLREVLEARGFVVERINYRVTLLFPLIWLVRRLRRGKGNRSGEAGSDLKPLPRGINRFLTALTRAENQVVTRAAVPFGSSVFGLARKG